MSEIRNEGIHNTRHAQQTSCTTMIHNTRHARQTYCTRMILYTRHAQQTCRTAAPVLIWSTKKEPVSLLPPISAQNLRACCCFLDADENCAIS